MPVYVLAAFAAVGNEKWDCVDIHYLRKINVILFRLAHSISGKEIMDFATLYRELFKSVFAYVLCRVGDRALAEDLCAAAWRKAYEKQEQFNADKGTFRQWIFTIARNEINMHHRLYYVRKFLSLTGWEEVLGEARAPAPEEDGENARLLEAVSHLNDREKELVALKFYSGLNNRQIAAQLHMTESNVGTALHRAVTKLRKEMKDE